MNGTLSKIIIFTAGAAIGSGVSWFILRSRYDQMVQEEIESVRESFAVLNSKDSDEEEAEDAPDEYYEEAEEKSQDIKYYKDIIDSSNYTGDVEENDLDEEYPSRIPEVIEPEEFGEKEGYQTVSMTYYEENKVLVDETYNEVVENVEELVGIDFDTHFGEYEDDSVHVRNHALETDFEILKVERAYSETK